MFDHVEIRAFDRAASERFYSTVLRTIGIAQSHSDHELVEWKDFGLTQADGSRATERLHVGFAAPSREHVDAFWRAGVDAGYRDDGAPGPRPQRMEKKENERKGRERRGRSGREGRKERRHLLGQLVAN
jgi:hypothetical protein